MDGESLLKFSKCSFEKLASRSGSLEQSFRIKVARSHSDKTGKYMLENPGVGPGVLFD